MGDHDAGTTGSTAIPQTSPTSAGKRAARHAVEQRTSEPYVGRRAVRVAEPLEPVGVPVEVPVAGRAPVPVEMPVAGPVTGPVTGSAAGPAAPYVGRRVADPLPGRRRAATPCRSDELDDVSAHLVRPGDSPTTEPYVGRRIARPVISPSIIFPPASEPPVSEALRCEPDVCEPVVCERAGAESLLAEPTVDRSIADIGPEELQRLIDALTSSPVPLFGTAPVGAASVETAPAETAPPAAVAAPPEPARPGARRASRRPRVPSMPLLAGVAVLAISAGGALQAMHPALPQAAADGHLSPASARSGAGAFGSQGVLEGRNAPVSRSADRQALSAGQLRAAADAQAKQRDQVLSTLRGKAEKQAAEIKRHQWVLPITPGVYHLTARFGDYSALWADFHTGLDFAAPTGTPIMAVAAGKITDVAYSGAYGNRTVETLPDGTELWYCHQNEFGTQVGASVTPGEVIGYVGSTGNVTGPHLHLEVHPGGGDAVDPYPALVAHGLYPGPPA
jgi:murein DD-endopeptidase MepM/ murein hydrolase activator NlpD